jgi:hypothetical protein
MLWRQWQRTLLNTSENDVVWNRKHDRFYSIFRKHFSMTNDVKLLVEVCLSRERDGFSSRGKTHILCVHEAIFKRWRKNIYSRHLLIISKIIDYEWISECFRWKMPLVIEKSRLISDEYVRKNFYNTWFYQLQVALNWISNSLDDW